MIRLTLAAALLAATPALAAEQPFPATGFDRIALGGSPEVIVATGKAFSVRATGDQKALDRLDIRVESGVLKIGSKRGDSWSWGNWGKVTIAVTAPMVRGIDVGGSGSVTVDRVRTPQFDAQVNGSGSIRLPAVDFERGQFGIAGSGGIEASGRCGDARMSISGSGRLALAGLKCVSLKADIRGSGDIDANASRVAAVAIAGSGDARIAGGARCTISKAGSGSVTCPG